MRARGGNGLCHDGHDYRLRLLEGGRGACHRGNGDCELDEKCRGGQGNRCTGHPADPRRTNLAVSLRVEERHYDRSQALAKKDHRQPEADHCEISVGHRMPEDKTLMRSSGWRNLATPGWRLELKYIHEFRNTFLCWRWPDYVRNDGRRGAVNFRLCIQRVQE